MKMLSLVVALLFSLNIFSKEQAPLTLTGSGIGTNSILDFRCIIPDHGGQCEKKKVRLNINTNLMPFNKIRIVNLTTYDYNSAFIVLGGLDLGDKVVLKLIVDENDINKDTILLDEGENNILLQILGINGLPLETYKVKLNTSISMDF